MPPSLVTATSQNGGRPRSAISMAHSVVVRSRLKMPGFVSAT
jgi:hypothetical protein